MRDNHNFDIFSIMKNPTYFDIIVKDYWIKIIVKIAKDYWIKIKQSNDKMKAAQI